MSGLKRSYACKSIPITKKIRQSAEGSSTETEVVVEASILYAETHQLKLKYSSIGSI
jgi:hypothetical protein